MAKVRPLSDLPKVASHMADVAKRMPDGVVPVLASNVRQEVEWQGHGYYIRGRRGQRVDLTAVVSIDRYAQPGTAARVVSGSPIGAWHIVEGGTKSHLITGAAYRTTRSGNVRRIGTRSRERAFLAGDAITGRPLRLPGIGFRQYALHPGARPVGRPWAKAMSRSDVLVARSLHEHAEHHFLKGWLA